MGVRQTRIDTIVALLKSKLVWPILAILLLAIFLTTHLPTADAPLGADRVLDATRATTTLTIRERLADKPAYERANIKATEIAKIDAVARERVSFSGANYDIEIVDIQKIDGGVEVFARAWTPDGTQIGFGTDGSVDIERFRIFNPPILVADPLGTIVRVQEADPEFDIPRQEFRFREDPRTALLQTLSHTIKTIAKHDSSKIELGKIGNTTSIFYPSMDGRVRYNSSQLVWASVIAAAGNQSITTETTLPWQVSGGATAGAGSKFDVLARAILVFDTSAIGDSDTISSSTFSGYVTTSADEFSVNPTMTIMGATLASDTTIANGDFNSTFTNHQTAFATAKAFSDFTAGYNHFSLNASGISAISKTGNSRFSLRFAEDITGGTTPQQASSAREFYVLISSVDETGTAQDPMLVVEHGAAGGSPAPKESVWDDV